MNLSKSNQTQCMSCSGEIVDNDEENLILSQDRAKAVFDYLAARGIDKKRLSHKGYGETQPRMTDEQIAKLTTEEEREAAHQANRRTEYKSTN